MTDLSKYPYVCVPLEIAFSLLKPTPNTLLFIEGLPIDAKYVGYELVDRPESPFVKLYFKSRHPSYQEPQEARLEFCCTVLD